MSLNIKVGLTYTSHALIHMNNLYHVKGIGSYQLNVSKLKRCANKVYPSHVMFTHNPPLLYRRCLYTITD